MNEIEFPRTLRQDLIWARSTGTYILWSACLGDNVVHAGPKTVARIDHRSPREVLQRRRFW